MMRDMYRTSIRGRGVTMNHETTLRVNASPERVTVPPLFTNVRDALPSLPQLCSRFR